MAPNKQELEPKDERPTLVLMLLVLHEAMTITQDVKIVALCLVVLVVMASKLRPS